LLGIPALQSGNNHSALQQIETIQYQDNRQLEKEI